ncbi:hypothetical protein [Thermoactinomyces sp. DSM 45892]|uniref:hypothetical protein n=1 Tax=Thermoactinomyces sp. DSM 45892 TaxID=1882753 RepID=UPI00089C64E7|nr:hypothetical protein [Thermoactinomyces sp. DSM 45892]SDX94923.1 hypothetical protein SAMN05444416_10181 [Thermoactinomyces sp. DSM 45892]
MLTLTKKLSQKEGIIEELTLTNPIVVKHLIFFRDQVDITYNPSILPTSTISTIDIEMVATYMSLDLAIAKCRFSKKELTLLNYLFKGYSVFDVVKKTQLYPTKTAYRVLGRIVNRIAQVS